MPDPIIDPTPPSTPTTDPATGTPPTPSSEPAAAGAAAASGVDGRAGAATALFWEGFKDEATRSHPSVTKYKDPEELARGLIMAEKRLGVPADQLLRIPTKPDDAAAYAEIFKKLGAPETAEGYAFLKPPADASDEVKGALSSLGEAGVKAGLLPAQLKPIAELMVAKANEAAQAEAAQGERELAEVTTALRAEWGGKFDTYKGEISRFLHDQIGEDGINDLNARGLGRSLPLMRLLGKMMDMRAEDGGRQGEGGRTAPDRSLTPAQAQAALNAINTDATKSAALRDKNHAQHAEIVAERNRLAQLAAGMTV